jgi:hypothetical protein
MTTTVEALVLGVLTHRLMSAVVLPGDREEIFRALRAGDRRGAGIAADEYLVRVAHRLVHGHHHVRENDAAEDVDAVTLDQRPDLGDRDIRLQFVVGDDDLHIEGAELIVHFPDAEQEAVAQVLAERRRGPGQRRHEADLEGLGLSGRGRAGEGDCSDQTFHRLHRHLPPERRLLVKAASPSRIDAGASREATPTLPAHQAP